MEARTISDDERFLDEAELKKKGEEFLDRITMNYEYFQNLQIEGKEDLKPIKKGDIPRLAVLLGLLDPFFFDLYAICDGKRSLSKLSQILGLDTKVVKILIDELVKKGLIVKQEE